ncbi:MAG: LysR family transcriptional regulator [Pseudomonadota bacterium]|nr:LysR family transcriptional regulator [Pseudomonadota bacterium]
MNDLTDIRAFVALAEAGSFAGAARRMSRDPTVLSRRVQALEARLGVRLAERTTRRVVLTEAGRLYLARVRRLLEELSDADRDAAALSAGEPTGQLRLALPATFGRTWLAPLVESFLDAFPRVSIEASYADRFVDLVGEGFDLAVRLGELSDSRLVVRKIGVRRRLVCASPTYLAKNAPPAGPQDLAHHACLCFTGRNDPTRWSFDTPAGAPAHVRVTPRVASDDADTLLSAALAGLGVLYTTDWHAGAAIREGRLIELLEGWPVADTGAIYLVMPARSGLPTKTRAFADWISDGLSPAPWLSNT